jgi:peptidoglycan hydrolase CwlO-like protein
MSELAHDIRDDLRELKSEIHFIKCLCSILLIVIIVFLYIFYNINFLSKFWLNSLENRISWHDDNANTYTDSIINMRYDSLERKISNFNSQFDILGGKINNLESKFNNFNSQFDKYNYSINYKIDNLDQTIWSKNKLYTAEIAVQLELNRHKQHEILDILKKLSINYH